MQGNVWRGLLDEVLDEELPRYAEAIERAAVPWPDRGEVPAVERRDLSLVQLQRLEPMGAAREVRDEDLPRLLPAGEISSGDGGGPLPEGRTAATMARMADRLAAASLRPAERVALEAAVHRLREELGDDLHAVWLYGSRARGEPPHEESDVDLLVITRGGWRDGERITWIVWDEADRAEARPAFFSVHVHDPEWLDQRRHIRSFFIQEVDRDKIVLAGSP